MLRETYRSLLKEALKHVCCGEGNVLVDNPAKAFTKHAKKGDFDIITDEQYMQALNDVNSISKDIWEMKEYQSWYMLLEKALRIKFIPDTVLSRIIQPMAAHCSDKFEQQKELYVYDPVYDEFDYSRLYTEEPEVDASSEEDDDSDPFPEDVMYDDNEILLFDEERPMPKPLKQEEQSQRSLPDSYHSLDTPKDIYTFLDTHVYGQSKAKRAAASLLWNHVKMKTKRNLVVVGPSGSGKTLIWNTLKEIFPNITIINSSQLSAEGWSGSYKLRSIFDNLSPTEAENRIYVFDEFDKCTFPVFGGSGTNYSLLVQNELLKLVEGNGEIIFPADDKTHQPELHLKTDNMSFVFLGSFESMLAEKNSSNHKSLGFGADLSHTTYDYNALFTPDDLVTFAGFRRELAGRIHQIVQLQPLTSDDYYAILQNPVISPITALEKQYGIHLSLDDASKHQLAEKAAESKMGVRYMTARLTEMLDEQLFSDCNSHEIMLSCGE